MTSCLLASVGLAGTALVDIPGGTYRPLYPPNPEDPVVEVGAFRIEEHPVTIGQFRAFVADSPEWAPNSPPGLFADAGYLASWRDGTRLPDDRPVTEVSWFAARAYCAAEGRRLPTEDEWERVARASFDAFDASDDPEWLATVLAWYGSPGGKGLPAVRGGRPNAFGVHDLHGVVWEWVEDFNTALVAFDAREAGDEDVARFCGVGALSASDVRDYANFMRVAWRSALEGRSTTRNMGFRCAAEAR